MMKANRLVSHRNIEESCLQCFSPPTVVNQELADGFILVWLTIAPVRAPHLTINV